MTFSPGILSIRDSQSFEIQNASNCKVDVATLSACSGCRDYRFKTILRVDSVNFSIRLHDDSRRFVELDYFTDKSVHWL